MRFILCVLSIAVLCAEPGRFETITRAQHLHKKGDLQAAERLLLTVVQESTDTVETALAYSDLGLIYRDTGRTIESERALTLARTSLVQRRNEPKLNLAWLRASANLASMYMETGQIGQAERVVNELSEIPVPEGDETIRVQSLVANLQMIRGRSDEAEQIFLKVAEWWTKAEKHGEAASTLNNLAVLAMQRDDVPSALSYIEKAWQFSVAGFGEDHPAVIAVMANYGSVLHRAGKHAAGLEWIERSLKAARRWHGSDARFALQIASMYSVALQASGRKKEARRVRTEVERMSTSLAARDPAVQTIDVLDLADKRRRRSR